MHGAIRHSEHDAIASISSERPPFGVMNFPSSLNHPTVLPKQMTSPLGMTTTSKLHAVISLGFSFMLVRNIYVASNFFSINLHDCLNSFHSLWDRVGGSKTVIYHFTSGSFVFAYYLNYFHGVCLTPLAE